jgi:hypothetical protein
MRPPVKTVRAKKPQRLPVVLARVEVKTAIESLWTSRPTESVLDWCTADLRVHVAAEAALASGKLIRLGHGG